MHKIFSFPGLGTILWFGIIVWLVASIMRMVFSFAAFIMIAAVIAIPVYGALRTKLHFEGGIKDFWSVFKSIKIFGEHPLLFGLAALIALSDPYMLELIIKAAIYSVLTYLGWWAIWGGVRKLTGSRYQTYHRAWKDAL